MRGVARLLITTKASNDEIHQKIITAPVSIPRGFETRKTLDAAIVYQKCLFSQDMNLG